VTPPPESEAGPKARFPGVLAWMTKNSVAATLILFALLFGGLLTLPRIKQEVFPEFEVDIVLINVMYPGASPADVEEGVLLAIEEAVRDVEGIKEVRGTAAEGSGTVTIDLLTGTNQSRALADVKSAVDRITSFPENIERPVVSLALNRKEVVSVVVHGEADEKSIRTMAEKVRDDLLNLKEIDVAELYGARPYEISVEVSREELRRYGLTLEDVARRVNASAVETPGGGVKTAGGEVLVRTAARKRHGAEFASIPIVAGLDGTEIRLGEIAHVEDGFQDTDQEAFFNGQRSVMVKVFRVGEQTPITISRAVTQYLEGQRARMPPGIQLSTWSDMSEIYEQRVDLLRRNGIMGLVLVMLVLGLFLDVGLAFWVTLGIPISFVGSLLFMPAFDASINMISLFAFIVTLGMVVDDAIVVGEAVYARRSQGMGYMDAAIAGVKEVAAPVIFAISTTMIAFAPMLFVPGPAGKFFRLIPIVVMAVLMISLVESLLVLPAHLSHKGGFTSLIKNVLLAPVWILSPKAAHRIPQLVEREQGKFARLVERFIAKVYQPTLKWALHYRYITMASSIAVLLMTVGLVGGGYIKFSFMPKVDGDVVVADLRMPYGTPAEETQAVLAHLNAKIDDALQKYVKEGDPRSKVRGVFSQLGARGILMGGAGPPASAFGGGHEGEVAIYLVPTDDRTFDAREFSETWRELVGEVPGVESLKFNFSMGPSAGAPIDIELEHGDLAVLELAAAELAAKLQQFPGVYAIDSGFSPGKEQLDMTLKPSARALGLTEASLASQLRSSFYGVEAVRQQRGRDELRVYVRLPREQRQSEYDFESLILRTPTGGEIPLLEAVDVQRGRSYTSIKRREGRRIVSVTADVDGVRANANEVVAALQQKHLPELLKNHDGLSYSLGGEQREQASSLKALGAGFQMALVAIFGLLAIAFRSYGQPAIIMAVIPFGIVGAILGHMILGYGLSMISMMGIVALSGVVVNDSLILIVAINRYREDGMSVRDAMIQGGLRRFRPIVLTSLTTFFGLVPMIFETSMQARFLIPMAISLGFGVLFATVIMLVLVPAVYAIFEDIKNASSFLAARASGAARALGDPAE
jgi:multidrug efflux pump subunit AcrB